MTSATTAVLLQLTSKTNLPRLGVTSNTVDVGMTSTSSDMLPEVTSNTTANLSEPPSFYIWTAAFIFLLVHHLSYLLQNHKMMMLSTKNTFLWSKTKKNINNCKFETIYILQVTSILGNTLVLWTVLFHRRMWSLTNYFLVIFIT